MNNSRHCVKMILELSQLLSTAHRVLDGELRIGLSESGRKQKQYSHPEKLLYKATHQNHPSAIYCRDSVEQYMWAATHLKALCAEYTFRYGKIHKAERDGLVDWLLTNIPKNIGNKAVFSLPYPAMPDKYIVPGDIVQSYRNYYMGDKVHLAYWSGTVNTRKTPYWWV